LVSHVLEVQWPLAAALQHLPAWAECQQALLLVAVRLQVLALL
jgi:hypothetical protein